MLEREALADPRFRRDGGEWWYHPPNCHRARAVTGTCEWCGEVFVRTASGGRSYRFCGNECYRAWRKDQRTVACVTCGVLFERGEVAQKHCSHRCYTLSNTGDNHVHFNGYLTENQGYRYYSRSHPEHPGRAVHNVRWHKANPGGTCERCGGNVGHIHHKDGDRKNNALANLEGLCVSCHMRHHHGAD